jgi:hypothetical protein
MGYASMGEMEGGEKKRRFFVAEGPAFLDAGEM